MKTLLCIAIFLLPTFSVLAQNNVEKKEGTIRVKRPERPDCEPTAMIAGKSGGYIPLVELIAATELAVGCKNAMIDLSFKIVSFNMTVVGEGRDAIKTHSNNNLFTADMTNVFKRLREGDKVYLEEIKVISNGGSKSMYLNGVSFIIGKSPTGQIFSNKDFMQSLREYLEANGCKTFSFSVTVSGEGRDAMSFSQPFSSKLPSNFNVSYRLGDKVYIEDIKCRDDDGKMTKVPGIVFTIQ